MLFILFWTYLKTPVCCQGSFALLTSVTFERKGYFNKEQDSLDSDLQELKINWVQRKLMKMQVGIYSSQTFFLAPAVELLLQLYSLCNSNLLHASALGKLRSGWGLVSQVVSKCGQLSSLCPQICLPTGIRSISLLGTIALPCSTAHCCSSKLQNVIPGGWKGRLDKRCLGNKTRLLAFMC